MENKEIIKAVYDAIEDKKGENIKIIDISKISVIADYFIIASGSNTNQIQAIADSVDEAMRKFNIETRQTEGYNSAEWVLLDYNNIVVHIFSKEQRIFYDLERIWRDGKKITIEEL